MKGRSIYSINGIFSKERLFRINACVLLAVFVINTSLISSVFSITVEEQARKRVRKKETYYTDEFTRKTPERRDYDKLPQEREPRLACLLSLMMPGGGHIYLKEDLKGIGIFASVLLGYSFAGYYLYAANKDDLSSSEKKSKYIISGLFFIVALIIHVVGIVEAYNDAIEINEEKYYYGMEKSKNPYIAEFIMEQVE